MNWKARLREIVLAGGALAAAACQGQDAVPGDASDAEGGVPSFCCNANGDPCCTFLHCGAAMSPACACQSDGGAWNYNDDLCSFDADSGPDAQVDASDAPADVVSEDVGVPTFCCNANSDPCCPFLYCGAAMSPACACQSDGGTWNNVGGLCSFEAGPSDAQAPPSDGPADVVSEDAFVSPFCCNLVSDPCCSYLHCGAPMSVGCACQVDGGTWTQSGSAFICSLSDDGGSRDAGSDGDGPD